MDNTNKTVNAISLFAGYGGLETGVRAAIPNLRVVAYVEREAYALNLLAQKIRQGVLDEAMLWPDVTTFPAKELAEEIPIHIVIAGYPCQDFSCAGKRAGLGGDKGKMWGFTRAVLNGCNAPAFIGENVYGHLSLGFDTVVSDLAEDGYRVDAGVQSAASVGLPHLRKRVFSFAIKADVRDWGIREPDELIQACRRSNREYELRDATSTGLQGATREELQRRIYGLTSDGGERLVGEQTGEPCEESLRERNGTVGTNGNDVRLRGSSTEYVSNTESCGQSGKLGESSRSDERRIQDNEREVGSDIRRDVESGSRSNGTKEMGDALRGRSSGRELGQLGGETGEKKEGGNKPTREVGYTGEEDGETEICLTIAKLYDEGYPSTIYTNGGEAYIDFSKDVGYSKHNGSSTEQELRSNEGDGSKRGEEEQGETIKLEGANRPIDESSVHRCEEGREQDEVGYPIDDGCSATEESREIGGGKEERGVQEFTRGGELHPVRHPAGPDQTRYDWEPEPTEEAGSKPIVGGGIDDATHGLHVNQIREDRIRLCGNGVVWLTAARAISEIYVKHKKWLTEFLDSDGNISDGDKTKS